MDAPSLNPMARCLLDFITANGGAVNFAKVHREIPGFATEAGTPGERIFLYRDSKNVVLWTHVSEEGAAGLNDLRRRKRIQFWPIGADAYEEEGWTTSLPVMRTEGEPSKPHWLPVAISAVRDEKQKG